MHETPDPSTDSIASETEPPAKPLSPWRWVWRLAAISAFFYLLGYFSHPATTPLMCKIYG